MITRLSFALLLCVSATCFAQRGEFNAREFVGRMDKNKNGILERDEVDGRAEGWLKRSYPEANFDKGVSVRKLADRMQKAHEERMRERGRDRDRDRDRDRRDDDDDASEYDLTALVPGFGEIDEELPEAIRFGEIPGGVTITKQDREKAKYVMDRYDRNKNGHLEMNERERSSWSDDPYKYDLNKDQKISRSELARRYAMHRVDESARKEKGLPSRYQGRGRRGDRSEDAQPKVEVIRGGGAASYTSSEERLPEGLPEWFAAKDKDGDGQLSMAEFLAELTTEEVAKFTGMDADNDGVLVATELGVSADSGDRKKTERVARSRDSGDSRRSTKTKSDKKVVKTSSSATTEKYKSYAAGRIKKYDKNGDGVLSIEECKAGKPGLVEADADKNGKITVDEVASYYQRLYKR